MNPISWIAEKLVTIVAQVIGNAVVTTVETEALKHHVNALGDLEAEARKHEEAGNPLLAKVLRDNSQRLAGRTDFTSLEFISGGDASPTNQSAPAKNISNGQPGKRKRGRPKKNSSPNLPVDSGAQDEPKR